MKRYKRIFKENLNLAPIIKTGRLKNISLDFKNLQSGLYNINITVNNATIASGIFDSDDAKILEKALELINSKIEKA
ncbi:MAG TPA: hypothetical protein PKK80_03315 [Bacilli bacterium]|nr:hypothetical protein [Bacilli bacterium]